MSDGAPPEYNFAVLNAGSNLKNPEGNPAGWTEQQVSAVVSQLGSSEVWKRYAQICLDENLDGATMTTIPAEMLVQVRLRVNADFYN